MTYGSAAYASTTYGGTIASIKTNLTLKARKVILITSPFNHLVRRVQLSTKKKPVTMLKSK